MFYSDLFRRRPHKPLLDFLRQERVFRKADQGADAAWRLICAAIRRRYKNPGA